MTKSSRPEAVSVIIPTYNRATLLPRAIRSALAATTEIDEIIVVDDGSTDDTEAVMAPWLDRVRYVRITNRGVGGARNYGVQLATKPLISFLDSDDEWFADKIALQRPFMMANPDVVFCFSDFAFHNDDTGEQERMYLKQWHRIDKSWDELLGASRTYSSMFPLPPERPDFNVHVGDLYPLLLEGLFTAAWTTLVRRELAGDALHFQEGIKICEDWWCYGQLARLGKVAFFNCETAWNHGHQGPRVTNANQFEFLSCRLQVTKDLWGRDGQFQRSHGELYNRTVAMIHRERAKWLLSRGRTREARADLRLAGTAGTAMRVLAALPGPVALLLGVIRRLAIHALKIGVFAFTFPPLAWDFLSGVAELVPVM
jgi:glycosyltransferase involved in cell wall biosynthesis